jgi:hypothetical protein
MWCRIAWKDEAIRDTRRNRTRSDAAVEVPRANERSAWRIPRRWEKDLSQRSSASRARGAAPDCKETEGSVHRLASWSIDSRTHCGSTRSSRFFFRFSLRIHCTSLSSQENHLSIICLPGSGKAATATLQQ